MFLEHQISILMKWKRETEDWNNGCWKFSFAITGINYVLKYIKIENSCFKKLQFLVYL